MRKKKYSIRQSLTGKLVVMVSSREPEPSPGCFFWTEYRPARQSELVEVVKLLNPEGSAHE